MSTSKQPRNYTYNHNTSFLPESIQRDLDIIVGEILIEFETKILMIWLFGSYARGDAVNDRRVDPETGVVSEYYSDIDILAICHGRHIAHRSTRWANLRGRLSNHPELSRSVHLLNDYKKRVNMALKNNEYFYADVVKEGIVLYNPNYMILNGPSKLDPKVRREYAIRYHNKFYQRADASRRTIMLHYQLGDLASCMHNLHQMTERLYYCYLLVFTHYKPRTHNLKELRYSVAQLDTHIQTLFPLETEAQQAQHKFLISSYVDARYNVNYHVEREQVEAYIEQIGAFQAWVLEESLQRIDSLIPEEPYSTEYAIPGEIMTLAAAKAQQLPQAVIEEQLLALQEKDKQLNAAWEEKLEFKTALEDSQQALEKEKDSAQKKDKQLEAALSREEKLKQKLRDAGIEP